MLGGEPRVEVVGLDLVQHEGGDQEDAHPQPAQLEEGQDGEHDAGEEVSHHRHQAEGEDHQHQRRDARQPEHEQDGQRDDGVDQRDDHLHLDGEQDRLGEEAPEGDEVAEEALPRHPLPELGHRLPLEEIDDPEHQPEQQVEQGAAGGSHVHEHPLAEMADLLAVLLEVHVVRLEHLVEVAMLEGVDSSLRRVAEVHDRRHRAMDAEAGHHSDRAEEQHDQRHHPDPLRRPDALRELLREPAEAAAEDEVEDEQRGQVTEQDDGGEEDAEGDHSLDGLMLHEGDDLIDHGVAADCSGPVGVSSRSATLGAGGSGWGASSPPGSVKPLPSIRDRARAADAAAGTPTATLG